MLHLPEKIVVFDTEYTSWEGAQARNWSGPGEYREIVEIGAVLVDANSFTELESLDLYVRPKRNPILSDYFINLTGITQEVIDKKGIGFTDALDKFMKWSKNFDMYSWGGDESDIKRNCELEQVTFPFDQKRFFDVRDIFSAAGISVKDYMSSTIVTAFGAKPSRRGHNGLSDARTIVDGLRLLARGVKRN